MSSRVRLHASIVCSGMVRYGNHIFTNDKRFGIALFAYEVGAICKDDISSNSLTFQVFLYLFIWSFLMNWKSCKKFECLWDIKCWQNIQLQENIGVAWYLVVQEKSAVLKTDCGFDDELFFCLSAALYESNIGGEQNILQWNSKTVHFWYIFFAMKNLQKIGIASEYGSNFQKINFNFKIFAFLNNIFAST